MRFRLTPRSMTLNCINSNFQRISQILDATTAKRMKIDQYCQRQRCVQRSFAIDFFSGAFIHALLSRAYRSQCYLGLLVVTSIHVGIHD